MKKQGIFITILVIIVAIVAAYFLFCPSAKLPGDKAANTECCAQGCTAECSKTAGVECMCGDACKIACPKDAAQGCCKDGKSCDKDAAKCCKTGETCKTECCKTGEACKTECCKTGEACKTECCKTGEACKAECCKTGEACKDGKVCDKNAKGCDNAGPDAGSAEAKAAAAKTSTTTTK